MITKTKSEVCLNCLECCKYISWNVPVEYIDEDFFSVREIELVKIKEGIAYLRIKKHCQHLTESGCAIYFRRPLACKTYDGRLDKAMVDKCKWRKL